MQRETVQIWLYENTAMKIEGVIVGFDEYMNIVLDNAEEVYVKSGSRTPVGTTYIVGDSLLLFNSFYLHHQGKSC